jgi:hypothetical protein
MYKINGKEYKLKEKYSLRDWGNILKLLSGIEEKSPADQIIILLADNKIIQFLNIILDNPIDDVYEDDFEEVNKIIKDFFSRKTSLMKNTESSFQS